MTKPSGTCSIQNPDRPKPSDQTCIRVVLIRIVSAISKLKSSPAYVLIDTRPTHQTLANSTIAILADSPLLIAEAGIITND